MHSGGLDIVLVNDQNVVCDSIPVKDDGAQLQLSSCEPMANVEIGDKLQVVAIYSNTKKIAMAMGAMQSFVYVEKTKGDDGKDKV